MKTSTPKFKLGNVRITDRARAIAPNDKIQKLLERHQRGDWGDMSEQGKRLNNRALEDKSQLLSVFGKGAGRIWIITDGDRENTVVLTPEDGRERRQK